MAKNKDLLQEGIKYFEQIRTLLLNYGIITSPTNSHILNTRKDGSKSIYLRIAIEKKSFKKYKENVGFDNPQKLHKLNLALNLT